MSIFEYNFSLSHVPGKNMYTADVLSRKPLTTASLSEDTSETFVQEYEMMAERGRSCLGTLALQGSGKKTSINTEFYYCSQHGHAVPAGQ